MRWLLKAAVLIALTSECLAQTAPSNSTLNIVPTVHTTTTLVVVPTLVQSPAKELIYSLKAPDFLLTDKGVPQKIAVELFSSQPLSLVVLMQTGGSAIQEFDKYRNLETMLEPILGAAPNQVSIVNFDSKPEAASPFTADIAQWRDAINHPDPGDDGAAILDSLKFALDLLKHQPSSNRRAILLISQPTDVGSKTTLKEIVRTVEETNTTVYTLTFSPTHTTLKNSLKETHSNPPLKVGDGTYVAYFNLSEPLGMILNAMRKNTAAELATISGGEAAQFDNQHQLDSDLAGFSNHLHNQYILTFTPTSSDPGMHPLQVRLINHPDLTVYARASYWLPAPDEQ